MYAGSSHVYRKIQLGSVVEVRVAGKGCRIWKLYITLVSLPCVPSLHDPWKMQCP